MSTASPTYDTIVAAAAFTTADVQEPGANVIITLLIALVLCGLRHFRPNATWNYIRGKVENLKQVNNDMSSVMWYDMSWLTFMMCFDIVMVGLASGFLINIYNHYFPSPGVPFKMRWPLDTLSIVTMMVFLLTRFVEYAGLMYVYYSGAEQVRAKQVANIVVFTAKFVNFVFLMSYFGTTAFLWDSGNIYSTSANRSWALGSAVVTSMAFFVYLVMNKNLTSQLFTEESEKALAAPETTQGLVSGEPKLVRSAQREFLNAYSVIGFYPNLYGFRRSGIKGFVPVMSIPMAILAAESFVLFYTSLLNLADQTKVLYVFGCIAIPALLSLFAHQSAYYFTYQCDMLFYTLVISYLCFWWWPQLPNNNLYTVNPNASDASAWGSTRQFYMVWTGCVSIGSILFTGWKMQSGVY